MVAALEKEFADLKLKFSIGGQISFDVFPIGYSLHPALPTQVESLMFRGFVPKGRRFLETNRGLDTRSIGLTSRGPRGWMAQASDSVEAPSSQDLSFPYDRILRQAKSYLCVLGYLGYTNPRPPWVRGTAWHWVVARERCGDSRGIDPPREQPKAIHLCQPVRDRPVRNTWELPSQTSAELTFREGSF